jgi:hypothetical protein
VLPQIAAVTCRHTSAPLTAMPGRGLHLDKSASTPVRVGEKQEVGPWAANTERRVAERRPHRKTCRTALGTLDSMRSEKGPAPRISLTAT